ncbi:hypothetical protein Sinac_2530 [Singulisphaera acidiphila DSM 18658]|uniref:Uncharacterized protein n=1 Tax=Singulisphaera acidiphila (strain ATCC BAA-1392 / DSM 18658 / VKM B-2454 / MOB10) TaxID=886293 RepID=L0DC75_SINAD|nr:hypothetical protein Sinac_2530 [Singulisphaera acidiphila DSM 18658]
MLRMRLLMSVTIVEATNNTLRSELFQATSKMLQEVTAQECPYL